MKYNETLFKKVVFNIPLIKDMYNISIGVVSDEYKLNIWGEDFLLVNHKDNYWITVPTYNDYNNDQYDVACHSKTISDFAIDIWEWLKQKKIHNYKICENLGWRFFEEEINNKTHHLTEYVYIHNNQIIKQIDKLHNVKLYDERIYKIILKDSVHEISSSLSSIR